MYYIPVKRVLAYKTLLMTKHHNLSSSITGSIAIDADEPAIESSLMVYLSGVGSLRLTS